MDGLLALMAANKLLLLALVVIAILIVTVGRRCVIGTVASSQDAGIGKTEYKVGDRFLEVSTAYDAGKFRDWVAKHPTAARGYAVPVLFPLDFIFMFALAGLMAGISGLAAFYLAGAIAAAAAHGPATFVCIAVGLAVAIPAAYLVADFIEDVVLILMLTSRMPITNATVAAVKKLTGFKIWSVWFSIWQTTALGVLALLWFVVAWLCKL